MFHVENVGIISSACICNGRRGRLLFERPGRDSKKQGGPVYTALDSKLLSPVTILGDEISRKAFNYGITAIRLNWDLTQHWYSLLQQRLKDYLHRLKGLYAFLARLSLYCTRSWPNTSNHPLCITSASRWKSSFGRVKSIAMRTMTYSLSYDISYMCCFHC